MLNNETLVIDPDSGIPIYQQIKSHLVWMMAAGKLNPGDTLPSVRSLSAQLKVNIQTIRMAYQRLEEDGLVFTRHGLGTVVQEVDLSRQENQPRTIRSHTIGVILPTMSNPFYQTFIEGVEKIASEDGTLLFLCCTHDDPSLALKFYRQLLARNVDGVILASCLIPGLYSNGIPAPSTLPVVIADFPGSGGVNVQLDLESAGYLGTGHLITHGHKRIGLITLKTDYENVLPIISGYRRAIDEANISFDETLVARVNSFQSEAGAMGARLLLNLDQPPTAIFCVADLLALGAMREIKRLGFSIPKDFAVVGFNDIPPAALSDPPLTSVAAPAFEMGVESTRRLRGLTAGETPAERELVLPTRLVVRESCGKHTATN